MHKTLKKTIRSLFRSQKTLALSAILSLMINSIAPIVLPYNNVVHAEDTFGQTETASADSTDNNTANDSKPVDTTITASEAPKTEDVSQAEQSNIDTTDQAVVVPSEPTTQEITSDTSNLTETGEVLGDTTTEPSTTVEPSITPSIDSATTPDILPDGATDSKLSEGSDVLGATSESKACISDGAVITASTKDAWSINNNDSSAETKDKVQLGVKYEFPLENGVSITFKCLPSDEGKRSTLKIQQVKMSELTLPESVNTEAEYAYDITTGMENGTFEFNLSLPKPEGIDVSVSYIEKNLDEIKNGKLGDGDVKEVSDGIDQKATQVEVSGLDHFTFYFVDTYSSSTHSVSTLKDTFTKGETVYTYGTSSTHENLRLSIKTPSLVEVRYCDDNNDNISCNYDLPNNAQSGTWRVELQTKVWQSGHWAYITQKTATFTVECRPTTGTLVVKKVVTNDNGGKKVASDFSFIINGGSETPFETDGQNEVTVNAGTYSVTEPATIGYTSNYDHCHNLTIAGGETKTCTITNNDIQPKLTVTKVVIGSNEPVSSFPLYVGATQVTSGIQSGFNAGIYTIREDTKAGYTAVIDGDCASDGSLNLNVGEVKACTITNTRETGRVTFAKIVDDGSSVANWIFTVRDPSGTQVGTYHNGDSASFSTGINYSVTESGSTDYLPNTVSGVCQSLNGSSATLNTTAAGGICTFSNTIKKGSITIIKDSSPNESQDFLFTTAGGLNPATFSLDDDSEHTLSNTRLFSSLMPGVYTISEGNVLGWSRGVPTCISNKTPNVTTAIGSASITLAAGENITCTFLNTKSDGSISGYKYEDRDGDGRKDSGEPVLPGWTIYLDANNNGHLDHGEVFTTTNSSGFYEFTTLAYGNYKVREVITEGWLQKTPTSDGGSYPITIGSGCHSFTNKDFGNRSEGTITIVKDATPNSDEDFHFDVTGGLDDFTLSDDGHGHDSHNTKVFSDVQRGSYTISERSDDHWTLSDINCLASENAAINVANKNVVITMQPGDEITCTFSNTKSASISGFKFNDENGNNRMDENEPKLNDWKIFIDGNDNQILDNDEQFVVTDGWHHGSALGNYAFDNLKPGNYQVCEVQQDKWISSAADSAICKSITVKAGEHEDDVNFANHQAITVIASKVVCNNEEDLPNWGTSHGKTINSSTAENWVHSHESCRLAEGWEFQWGKENSGNPGDSLIGPAPSNYGYTTFGPTNESGVASATIDAHNEGRLEFREVLQEGYIPFSYESHQGNRDNFSAEMYCSNDVANYDNWDFVNDPKNGNTYYCVAFNASQARGSISGYKFYDGDENGTRDEDETTIEGWNITLFSAQGREGGELVATGTTATNEKGEYQFSGLVTGNYLVCEESKSEQGWSQTSPSEGPQVDGTYCHTVKLSYGQDITGQDFGNVNSAKLLISKTNHFWPTIQHVGSRVMYIMTLEAVGGSFHNVKLTDLLPDGFKYVQGSATVDGSSITDPSYHSPGEWNIENLNQGQKVTLTYQANIGADVAPGVYPDLAWADGLNDGNVDVIASSVASDFPVDGGIIGEEGGTFVGTEIRVAAELGPELSAKVTEKEEEKEEVLGASTSLPATGASTNYVVSAIMLLTAGMGMFLLGSWKKKSVKVLLVGFAVLAITGTVRADNSRLSARVYEPDSIVSGPFNLTYVALDTSLHSIAVECQRQGPSDSDFVKFSDETLSTGGNTAVCKVDSSVLTEQGAYEFRVLAIADSDSVYSNTVSTTFDTEGPDRPKSITKDKKNSCKYELTIKTANDGQTASVEIFRDDDKTVEANSSSLIATINVGANEKINYTDNRGGSDCHTPYYAVRAFDAPDGGGNGSDLRAEEITTTETRTVAQEGKENQLGAEEVPGGANLPGRTGGGSQQGEVAGESTQSLSGESSNGITSVVAAAVGLAKSWIFWVVVLIGAIILVNALRKKKTKK